MMNLSRLKMAFIAVMVMVTFWLSAPANALPKYSKVPDPVPTTDVAVNVYLSTINTVDSQAENWSASGYIVYEWVDKRTEDGVYQSITDLPWHPAIEVVNASEYTIIGEGASAKDGVVTAQERVRFVLSTPFKLNRFPFDTQKLELAIESLQSPDLLFRTKSFKLSSDNLSSLSEWNVSTDTSIQTRNVWPPDGNKYSRLTFYLNAKRNSAYYLRKIILPIIFLTFCSIASIFLAITESSTQLSLVATTALASLTLWLLSSDAIARTPVNSILDTIVYGALFANFVVLLFIIGVQKISEKYPRIARRTYNTARVSFPIAYSLYNLAVLIRY